MHLPFGLIRGGGISWRLPFGRRRVELKSAFSSCLVGDGGGTGSTDDCESVEDDRRLSPERGEVDSHHLESSSLIEAGDGGYCCPMDASEFESASRSDKEAGPSSSRVTEEEEVDSASHPVAEDAISASCLLAKVVDSVSPSVVKELGSASGSEVEEVDSGSGSEVEEVDAASGSEVEEVDWASGSEV